jgi:site-specific DNA-cytosine methylase
MKGEVLIACEESQAVTKELRLLGIEAFSCDILETSGDNPEWHIEEDVIPLLKEEWDLVIAFPPCTHLAASGARWFEQKIKDGRQQQGIDFFMACINANSDKVAVENPVGIMSTKYRKPDQIIQPYEYGDSFSKKTCLWLKGLPLLVPTNIVDKDEMVTMPNGSKMSKWYRDTFDLPKKERAKARSKTFPGIAKAMAEQWGLL